jgi:hypothetical protein
MFKRRTGVFQRLSKSRVTLRLAVYRQSVRLGSKLLAAHDQRFIFATEPLLS